MEGEGDCFKKLMQKKTKRQKYKYKEDGEIDSK